MKCIVEVHSMITDTDRRHQSTMWPYRIRIVIVDAMRRVDCAQLSMDYYRDSIERSTVLFANTDQPTTTDSSHLLITLVPFPIEIMVVSLHHRCIRS